MPITFGKIAYVSNTPASMLDRMGMSVNTVAQNDGLVIVSCDTIINGEADEIFFTD